MNAIQNVSPVVASTGWAKMRAAGKTVIRVACWRRPPCESQTTSRYKPKHAVPAHTPRATNSTESPRSFGPSSPAFADLATSCPRNPAHRHAIPIAIASQTISRTGRGRLREPGPHRRAASDSLACVRQIYPAAAPAADDDDFLARRYAYPAGDGTAARPWVRANMVASVDGAAALEGRSGGLGGAADPPPPPIAVVTASLDLDPGSPLLAAAPDWARTIVLTTAAAPADRRAALARQATVIEAGEKRGDARRAIDALAALGHTRILTEGGPKLLGHLAAAGRLDDLCLTIGPLLAGGDGSRIRPGSPLPGGGLPLTLAHVLAEDGSLFCRYLRAA